MHLSDVRFCPPHRGRAGAHHPLAVLAGVRGAPPALQLGGGALRSARRSRARSSLPALASTTPCMSKRKLRQLVEERPVSPAGTTPVCPRCAACAAAATRQHSIRNFCERIGVSKASSTVEYAFLEHCLREDLNDTATRVMAVLRPVAPDDYQLSRGAERRSFDGGKQPEPAPDDGQPRGHRSPAICGLRQDDFLEKTVAKYNRLFPGGPEVPPEGCLCSIKLHRLRQGCGRQSSRRSCANMTRRAAVVIPPTAARSRAPPSTGWRPATAVDAEVRLYRQPVPRSPIPTRADKDFLECLNPDSLRDPRRAARWSARSPRPRPRHPIQFMRLGYFCPDSQDSDARSTWSSTAPSA